jgi:hypothetical protein
MAISDSDWQHLQSASAGSSGGAITASGITSAVKNNVWTDVDNTERLAGGVEYRKTFWKNNHATDGALAPVIYTPVLPSNATLRIGLGVNSSADDDPAQGLMSAFSAAALVALISDGTDTRVATIRGLDAAGDPQTEQVTLTSAVEVLSAGTYSVVYNVSLASTSATRTVTVKQGSGGTTRGTIGPNKIVCWLWITPTTAKATGIEHTDLAAQQNIGLWRSLTWIAGAARTAPNTLTIRVEEA